MDLTEELAARVFRVEVDEGPEPGTRDPTEDEYGAMADALLADHPGGDLWLFAYGSLIWAPDHETLEERRAVAPGWHRSFCFRLTRWRGTRAAPALMLALDRGGSCSGFAHRLPAVDSAGNDHRGQLVRLLKREIDAIPATNVARWIGIRTAAGRARALAFVADPKGPAYAGRLSPEAVAATTARAVGHWGTAADYVQKTIARLEAHGIRDVNLWRLQSLVAAEIRRIHPDPAPGANALVEGD